MSFSRQTRKNSEMASQFSEKHLSLAVYDDKDDKLPDLPNCHTSLGEILQKKVFQSQSKEVIRKTIQQIADEAKAIEDAKKLAILAKFQRGGRNKISMTLIRNFLERKKGKERRKKAEERRKELGLPTKRSLKKTAALVKNVNIAKRPSAVVSLPKLPVEQTEPIDSDMSYGKFLYNEFSSSVPKLPEVNVSDREIPSRVPTVRNQRKIPKHLERFKYMRIMN